MSTSKKLIVPISQGFQERMFVKSGLLDRLLQENIEVIVISPVKLFEEDERFRNIVVNVKLNRIKGTYVSIRKLALWRRRVQGALKNFENNLKKKNKKLWYVQKLFRLIPFPIALFIDKNLIRENTIKTILKEENPDAVLLASPGFSFLDAVVLNEAKILGKKTIVVGQSWDNFSTKGYVNPKPDVMIVWGEQMKDEAINLQGFDPRKIFIAGASHFDAYYNLSRFGKREEVIRKLGLFPERKLIVYGTSPRVHAPNEYLIVKKLANLINTSPNKKIKFPVQMVIRLHPQQVIGEYASQSEVEMYKSLESEYVKIDIPKMKRSKLAWYMDDSEYERLPFLLSHADVAINTLSTFSLDAIAAGVPVISTLFDIVPPEDFFASNKKYFTYLHAKSLIKTGGVKVVNSFEELIEWINKYIENPSLHKKGRERLLKQQLFRIDGKATERISEIILRALKNP